MGENSSDYEELEAAGEYLDARRSELRDIARDLSEAAKRVREAQLRLSEVLGHLLGKSR